MREIYIYGASGHGKVVAEIAKNQNHTILGFIDDDISKIDFNDYKCFRLEDVPKNSTIALAIGSNSARQKVANKIAQFGCKIISLIHSSAIISSSAQIGQGSVIMPLAIVNADAKIGIGAIINSGAIIEHECEIGDFVHICPRVALAGNVKVDNLSWIGIGSCIIQGKTVGKNVMLGAGAVVIRDVADNSKVAGVPAVNI